MSAIEEIRKAHAVLLDANAKESARLGAIDRLVGADHLLRSVMLLEKNAHLRAKAAEKLRRSDWLFEALADPQPSVRAAALGSLARCDGVDAKRLRERCLEEPIWWVRRAAVWALVSVAQADCAETLLAVLDDPFWRVRNAAVQALLQLAEERSVAEVIQQFEGRTDSAKAALVYLRRRLKGINEPIETVENWQPRRKDGIWNEDPAVITARLEDRNKEVPPALLLELLTDSHESLRRIVAERLLEMDNPRAHTSVMLWLDEPRIPHAVEAATYLLDRLGDRARTLAEEVLSGKTSTEVGTGALLWAITWVKKTRMHDLSELVVAHLDHRSEKVRCTAIETLAALRYLPLAKLEGLLKDEAVDVRSTAARAFDDAHALVERCAFDQPTSMRRVLVEAAASCGHLDLLQRAATDPDAQTRALALRALEQLGDLSDTLRDEAKQDADPWIRKAVVHADPMHALLDSDIEIQRAALDVIAAEGTPSDQQRAAALVCDSVDAWQRAKAARLFSTEDLNPLLPLSADREPMVRAAAADTLEPVEAARFRQVAKEVDAPMSARKAAVTWLLRTFDETALQDARVFFEIDELAQHTKATLHAFPEALLQEAGITIEAPQAPPSRKPAPAKPIRPVSLRPLGKTGLEVSPLAISGVWDLNEGALRQARQAGVNLFFWEPRHLMLTRFLRRVKDRNDLNIIAGSFHGSEHALRKDVHTALRRLGTDYIDCFLVFWVRSIDRLSDEVFGALDRLRDEGKIRSFGFSTHHREIACEALRAKEWGVVMTRHNAAHTGAERTVFPVADELGVGVLTFSALCYGRMLGANGRGPSAADCYRYSLSQPGVSACISAPRRYRELLQNLEVLQQPTLTEAEIEALRRHGQEVYAKNKNWAQLIRSVPTKVDEEEAEPVIPFVEEQDSLS